MKSIGRRTLYSRGLLSAILATLLSTVLFATLLSSTAFAWQSGAATATKQAATASKPANTASPASTLTDAERKATGRIKLETIREITTKLSSKGFEGRGTGQPGADQAAACLADLLRSLVLNPTVATGEWQGKRFSGRSNSEALKFCPRRRGRRRVAPKE